MTDPEPDATAAFLGLPQSPVDDADFVLLPLPFEGTVSYGKGTAAGPDAVLEASAQVEFFDDETGIDLQAFRYHTAPPVCAEPGESPGDYLARVRTAASGLRGRRVIGVGGEHSVTPPLVFAAAGSQDLSSLTIVQIDAHTDLRHEYEGTVNSHACAMRRLVDKGARLVAIGIRASCQEEIEFAQEHDNITIMRAQTLANDRGAEPRLLDLLRRLSGDVYLTVDVDGLCPSLCPSTGTPEPGGLDWWQTLRILRALLREAGDARLIGCDFVETVPAAETRINEFTTARLIARTIAYLA